MDRAGSRTLRRSTVIAADDDVVPEFVVPRRQAYAVAALTVLYDSQCPVCRRARGWVAGQLTLVPIEFVAAGSQLAQLRFPHLDHGATLKDITVLDDEGRFYRGDRAWIMVLWAVASTRPMAIDVARGRKQRMFSSIKGATELARRVTASAPTPPARAVPPPLITGWNAPGEDGMVHGQGASACVGDTCR